MSTQFRADAQRPVRLGIETARLAALASYQQSSSASVEVLSQLSREAATNLAATQAAVSFVAATRVRFEGAFGLSRLDAAREHSFCDAVVRSASPLLVPDGRTDPRFWQHEMVRGDPGLRCYAGAPLIDHSGYTLGAVAIFSAAPAVFPATVLHDLSRLAVLVRDFLAEMRSARSPAGSTRHLEQGTAQPVQGWLGVKTLNAREGNNGRLGGLLVLSVAQGSPAQRAGIRPTDVLQSIGGRDLFVPSDVTAALAGYAAGAFVQVLFRRLGQWHRSEVEIRPERRRFTRR